MKFVDLHTHSNKSDGMLSPTELVNYAKEKGLAAIALSDHDTTDGIDEALAAAKNSDLEVIPAIEFSTEYQGKDIHILGLYIRHKDPAFLAYLKDFQDSRTLRNKKMCAKLTEHGVPVTFDELQDHFKGSVLTRAHYARYLLDKGFVKSMPEAFDRYVGDHAPCFIPREKVSPFDAVKLTLQAGGIPILAHPILYHMSDDRLDTLVRKLKAAGLVGIEAIYSTYKLADERQIRGLAQKYNLLLSGGSDFHGSNKPGLDLAVGYGKLFVPYEVLENLKNYKLTHSEIKDMTGKIIFSDMDGTLLDDTKNISKELHDRIIDFINRGGRFVLSSGRPLDSIIETAEKIGLYVPGAYIISYNGALVYDCDKQIPILERCIPKDYVKKILEFAKARGIHAHTYEGNAILSPEDDKELAFYRINVHLDKKIDPELLPSLTKDPYKMLFIDLDNETTHSLDQFAKELEPEITGVLHTFYSSPIYMECCLATASKGNAVRFLCDYLHIDIKNAIAAGDAANDISMLEAAGIGVAMINGTEETKAVADYVTKNTNNEDGFLELFSLFAD